MKIQTVKESNRLQTVRTSPEKVPPTRVDRHSDPVAYMDSTPAKTAADTYSMRDRKYRSSPYRRAAVVCIGKINKLYSLYSYTLSTPCP